MKLNGKIAYVTGGAFGIGLGVVKMMLKYGATVVVIDNNERVFEVANLLSEKGYNIKAYQVDVRDKDKIRTSVEETIRNYGRIDILVNNAGIFHSKNFLEETDEERDEVLSTNLIGSWNVTKIVLPYMINNNYGKIVNISSIMGEKIAKANMVSYATSKSALIGFTKSLASEYASKNITVNAIIPGFIKTPALQEAVEKSLREPAEVYDEISYKTLVGRLGKINEIGEVASFLASEEASFITGEVLTVDGGYTSN